MAAMLVVLLLAVSLGVAQSSEDVEQEMVKSADVMQVDEDQMERGEEPSFLQDQAELEEDGTSDDPQELQRQLVCRIAGTVSTCRRSGGRCRSSCRRREYPYYSRSCNVSGCTCCRRCIRRRGCRRRGGYCVRAGTSCRTGYIQLRGGCRDQLYCRCCVPSRRYAQAMSILRY